MVHNPDRKYDARTAITFLLAGLGLGALTTLLMAPRPRPEVLVTTQGSEASPSASIFP